MSTTNVHTVTFGDKNNKLVQIAESDGIVGQTNFRYEEKLTVSPVEAYYLLLGLVATLQNDFGYALKDDAALQRVLETSLQAGP